MSSARVFYSPDYYADIGEGHVFPIKKFELVRDILVEEGTLLPENVIAPEPVSVEDVRRVHTEDYVERLVNGELRREEIRLLGLPWSEALVRRSFLAVSGTIRATFEALSNGVGSNLAGGTHHAFPDRGEGFCVLNDVAIAIEKLKAEERAERFLIVDLDVHQGNGTASIYRGVSEVYTFSMHGKKNYPLRKERSDLDIELEDGTGDDEYLSILSEALPRLFSEHPDVVFLLAGADPFEDDQLGRLGLTKKGLMQRDKMVLESARAHATPVITVMSGGYGRSIHDTVDIHCNTIRAVNEVFYREQTISSSAATESPFGANSTI